jgi:hypothetical protein
MPRRKGQVVLAHTRENYDRLLVAYRQMPGLHTRVAATVGVDYATAKKAWDDGWNAKTCPWAQPIQHVLLEEQESVRAERERREKETREKEISLAVEAREDAIRARAEEAVGAKVSRSNAIGVGLLSSKLVVGMQKLVDEINLRLGIVPRDSRGNAIVLSPADQVRLGSSSNLSFDQMRQLLALGSHLVERSQRILRHALDIERIVAGDPKAVAELRNAEGLSPDEVVLELTRLTGVMERARERYRQPVLDAVVEDGEGMISSPGVGSGEEMRGAKVWGPDDDI